jgi:hypothetical protein
MTAIYIYIECARTFQLIDEVVDRTRSESVCSPQFCTIPQQQKKNELSPDLGVFW